MKIYKNNYLLNYFRWGDSVRTANDKMPYMTLYEGSVYGTTFYHELWHVLSYNFVPKVKQEAIWWYIESSANWFTTFYDKREIPANSGVFYAKPYLSLWHSPWDKVTLSKSILKNQNPN